MIGGVFSKQAGDTNWFVRTGKGTGVTTRVDTGIGVGFGDWQKLRVEWHGSSVADDSAGAMRFYIGGVMVGGSITTDLPRDAATPRVTVIGAGKRTSGSTAAFAFVGPVQYCANY